MGKKRSSQVSTLIEKQVIQWYLPTMILTKLLVVKVYQSYVHIFGMFLLLNLTCSMKKGIFIMLSFGSAIPLPISITILNATNYVDK